MRGPCIHSFITLIGSMSVTEDGEGRVTALYLPNQNLPAMEECETEVLSEAAGQVNEYLSGRRRSFDLPLLIDGSEFRRSVLGALVDIPYGEVRTYGQIAAMCGFHDPFYFSKMFKRRFGVPPIQFRAQSQNRLSI